MKSAHNAQLLSKLAEVVGPEQVLTGADAMSVHLGDWRGRYRGDALCVVRPASTADVSAVVRAHGAIMRENEPYWRS